VTTVSWLNASDATSQHAKTRKMEVIITIGISMNMITDIKTKIVITRIITTFL
jgi:hypothetical protein